MAFIRWKQTESGERQAYLVHSYRDETGKPKHKILAYLGGKADLTPEHIAQLKEKFSDIRANWDRIVPPSIPKRKIDVTNLSDDDILSRLREIRHDLGFNSRTMAAKLQEAGLTTVILYKHQEPMTYRTYKLIEYKFITKDHTLQNYTASVPQIAAAVRHMCSVHDNNALSN